MRFLVISVQLYACESWTLISDILKKLQATDMRCFRKLLGTSYRDHITNDVVRDRIRQATGPHDDLNHSKETQVQVVWACIKIIRACQDDFTTNSARREKKGRQKKHCENNIAEWTGLKFCDAVRDAENKIKWRERVATSVAPQRSLTTG